MPRNAPPDANEALRILAEGNARFTSGVCAHPSTDPATVARCLDAGQRPVAAVLACADSRVPVERVFDLGVGDLFVVRVAGAVCGVLEAASLEYAVAALGCRLVVVMGHAGCGAVAAACAGTPVSDPLDRLLAPIRECARAEREADDAEDTLIDRVVEANVRRSIWDLQRASRVVQSAASGGEAELLGAVYQTGSGRVVWIDG